MIITYVVSYAYRDGTPGISHFSAKQWADFGKQPVPYFEEKVKTYKADNEGYPTGISIDRCIITGDAVTEIYNVFKWDRKNGAKSRRA
jgi:hypothetical protein